MTNQSAAQIEQELAKLQADLEKKQRDLEVQKLRDIEALKAKREKGIRSAWDKLTQELLKADLVAAPDTESIATESGKKRSETTFNKKCYKRIGEIMGIVEPVTENRPSGQRGKLNDDQKTKIEKWVKEGLSVADMNKKIYTNPTSTTYQRVNKYVKKVKG